MGDKNSILQRNWEHQREEAHRKAAEAIRVMEIFGIKISFCSVGKQSGVSKSFLYNDPVIRQTIEQNRAKYDKTSSSKDVIIKAKDKRIAKRF